MASRSQKIKLGVFLTASSLLLAATVIVFAGLAFLTDRSTYYVQFSESVSGLDVGAPVKFRGVPVGTVEDIALDPGNVELVRVEIAVDDEVRVPEDATALLMMQGITGLRFVEIRGGTAAAEPLAPGSYITAGESVFTRLSGNAEDLALQADQLMSNLLHITGADNRERVAGMLERGDDMAEHVDELVVELTQVATQTHQLLRENRPHIRGTLANIDRTSDEVAALATQAGAMLDDMDPDTLEASVASLGETLDSLDELLGSVTRILDQSRGEIRGILHNVRLAAESFRELGESLRRQPRRLFFGGSPGERELP